MEQIVEDTLLDNENQLISNSTAPESSKNETFENTTRLRSYLRIRPVGVDTSSGPSESCYEVDLKRLIATAPPSSQTFKNSKGRKQGIKKAFTFDEIYDEHVDQKTVYESAVRPLVHSFFQGDNALLFAYGMTSSGKSFTMRGNHKDPGVIPRSIHEVFNHFSGQILEDPLVKRSKFNEYVMLSEEEMEQELAVRTFILNQVERIDKSSNYSAFYNNTVSSLDLTDVPASQNHNNHKKYIFWISFLELYNDMLFDLLAVEFANERTIPLKLVRDTNENYFVNGLRHVFVRTAEDAHKVMLFGLENLKKHVQSTGMNKHSSRSHAVFTISLIELQEIEAETSYEVLGVRSLSLSDLAGRERAVKTGNIGIRMQEANRINVSLLVLNHCISVLRKNQKNNGANKQIVPFSNSNLTKVYKPFLCGRGLTAMFININPLPEHFDETYATLEFSATASEIVITKVESKKQLIGDSLRQMTQLWLDSNKKKRKIERTDAELLDRDQDPDLSYVLASQVRESILKNVSVLSDEIGLEEIEYYKALIQQLQTQVEELQSERVDGDLERQVEVTKKLFELDAKLRREFDERNERDIARVEYVMNEKIAMIEEEHRLVATEHLNRIDELQDQVFESMENINQLQHDLKNKEDEFDIRLLLNDMIFDVSLGIQKEENEVRLRELVNQFKKPARIDCETSISGLNANINQSFAMQTDFADDHMDTGTNTSILRTNDAGTDACHISMVDRNTSICFARESENQVQTSSPDYKQELAEMKHELRMLQAMLDLKDKTCSALEERCQKLQVEIQTNKHTLNETGPALNITSRNLEAPLTERKKKRELSDSSNDICQQYLNLIKDISPKTNRKKKRTNSESTVKSEIDVKPEFETNENGVDDLAFLIEGPKLGTKKGRKSSASQASTATKGRRGRKASIMPELTVIHSARKKMTNNHRDSFVIESEEAIVPNQAELNRTGRKLRSGRRINTQA